MPRRSAPSVFSVRPGWYYSPAGSRWPAAITGLDDGVAKGYYGANGTTYEFEAAYNEDGTASIGEYVIPTTSGDNHDLDELIETRKNQGRLGRDAPPDEDDDE